ncbi:hypothetical protein FRC11_014021 [Ceratobasidium sp. 423]|nr:hypothetical protein FRC11_014021 [Ceratobasidium sp. 423]
MKVFLPVAANVGPKAAKATHVLLKFMYLAHSSTLTEEELGEMDKQLVKFHELKSVFNQHLKSKCKFHNILKFHSLQHYTYSICMLGTPDGYNTEAPESLHIDLTKAGFNASNKIDDTKLEQMTKYIQCMDSLVLHQMYLNFIDQPEGDEGEDWRDGWENHDNFDDEENPFDLDNREAEGSDDNMDAHLDTCSDASSDEDEDKDENDLAEGCVVQMVIDTVEDTQGRLGT